MTFIKKFEWVRLKAYYDHTQWSIWFGTKSYKWEVITSSEAHNRMLKHLSNIFKIVDNNKCFNDNQKIALTSYIFNTGWWQMNLRKYINICSHKDIKYIMSVYWYSSNWKRLQWLVKRRIAELNLYNK